MHKNNNWNLCNYVQNPNDAICAWHFWSLNRSHLTHVLTHTQHAHLRAELLTFQNSLFLCNTLSECRDRFLMLHLIGNSIYLHLTLTILLMDVTFFLITPEKLGFKSYVLLSIVLIHKLSVCCVENIKSPWIIYWDKYMTGGKLIHLQLIVRYIPKFNCSYWRWFSCYIVFPLLVERLERAACWQTQIYGKFLLKQGLSEVWRQWAGATRKEL